MRCDLVTFDEIKDDPIVADAFAAGNLEVGGARWTQQKIQDIEKAGLLLFWRIYVGNKTVGFCAMMQTEPHCCVQAALFIFGNDRSGGTARDAIKEIDKQLITRGITRIFRHVRTNGVGYLHGMGYDFVESLHVLDVGGNNG